MAFQWVQTGYWLALSTWLGGLMFVALAAPVIFRSIAAARPMLPSVLAVNLDNQHATLLAGTVIGDVLTALARVFYVCAAVAIACAALQFVVADTQDLNRTAAVLRVMLLTAAAGVLIYDRRWVATSAEAFRSTFIENADEPDIANPAREAFDREHRKSINLLMVGLCLLVATVLLSVTITPRGGYSAPQMPVESSPPNN